KDARILLLLLVGTAMLSMSSAAQQQNWPNRVVRIIATSSPGGSIDLLARIIAEDFNKALGQPFIVENRLGANGNLGVDLVRKAPASGHMLFVPPPGPYSTNVNLYASMPFNPATDVAPIALLGISPLLLVVHPSLPAHSFKELLAFMRAHGGKVNYASQAIGSSGQLPTGRNKCRPGGGRSGVPRRRLAARASRFSYA